MKILSMTATFGKLAGETLTLEPGLNVVEAPNEWGKSTWCAFLEAMLYGIDTAARSKTGFLAEKEHYAPWSGAPMSGRMEILWQGRKLTIERKSKGRAPLGEVRVYETDTGLDVPELSVNNCGEKLLGVERSIFVRAGFLKQSQMPVTEDEKLRRRLNELVTTGDESGQSDMLYQKLKDLKNRCKFNKKGLIPELELQLAKVEEKLRLSRELQEQIAAIKDRQAGLKEDNRLLENHLAALSYQENLAYTQKVAAAQVARDGAKLRWEQQKAQWAGLPTPEKLQGDLDTLRRLRDDRESLTLQAQGFGPLPEMPYISDLFRGKDPEQALKEARQDLQLYQQLQANKKRSALLLLGLLMAALGLAGVFLLSKAAGGALLLGGIALAVAGICKGRNLQKQMDRIAGKYPGLAPDRWVLDAEHYQDRQVSYERELSQRRQELESFNRSKEENQAALSALTGGLTPSQFEQQCLEMLGQHRMLLDLDRSYRQAEDFLQALSATGKEVAAPTFPDELSLTAEQTKQALSKARLEEHALQQKLGQCQGQLGALGDTEQLESQRAAMLERKAGLEQHYRALTMAMETLESASRELQRRFAPRLSQRAQVFFSQLTGGRYQRLSLCQDLSLEAAAEGETVLRSSLWRSEGTADQLYLALRLAVAEELTPEAPMILDDALVRFDDTRLAAAVEILQQMAQTKQVILFTCQSREKKILS